MPTMKLPLNWFKKTKKLVIQGLPSRNFPNRLDFSDKISSDLSKPYLFIGLNFELLILYLFLFLNAIKKAKPL